MRTDTARTGNCSQSEPLTKMWQSTLTESMAWRRRFALQGVKKAGLPAQQYAYDSRGRITGLVNGNRNEAGYGLDSWGRIKGVQTADGGKICLGMKNIILI